MHHLRTSIPLVWVAFWVYWLISAIGAKAGSREGRPRLPGVTVVVVLVLVRLFKGHGGFVHNPAVGAVGTIVFVCGLGLAVWARVYLGRNWGLPMSRKNDAELVTCGPYHFVRHPIYSGILLALAGTALAVDLYLLVAVAIVGTYFVYSAKVEEGLLADVFPTTYPAYRSRTKMLVPFVL